MIKKAEKVLHRFPPEIEIDETSISVTQSVVTEKECFLDSLFLCNAKEAKRIIKKVGSQNPATILNFLFKHKIQ